MNKKTFLEELEKRRQIQISGVISPLVYKHENKILCVLTFLNDFCLLLYENIRSSREYRTLTLDSDTFYYYLRLFKVKPEKFIKDLDFSILENL